MRVWQFKAGEVIGVENGYSDVTDFEKAGFTVWVFELNSWNVDIGFRFHNEICSKNPSYHVS